LAFWSGDKLLVELSSKGIVTPFSQKQIDCSSYRLRLGSESFVTPDYDMKLRDSVKRTLAEPADGMGGGQVAIPPGQFAFLLTEEILNIPDTVMGFISMRAGFKMNGLINVSGFHVDPGFQGRLVFAVYNAGPATVNISRGESLFLLWIASLDVSATEKFSRKAKLSQIDIPNDYVSRVNYPLHSLQNLSKDIKSLEDELKVFKRVIYVIGGVIGLILAGFNFFDRLNNDQEIPRAVSEPNVKLTKPQPAAPSKSGAAPAP
jgi:dCTP deaminase